MALIAIHAGRKINITYLCNIDRNYCIPHGPNASFQKDIQVFLQRSIVNHEEQKPRANTGAAAIGMKNRCHGGCHPHTQADRKG
ncbi:hypothetical protein LDL36_06665 [Komagataeibacter sp. FNDCR1]|nr:hypothetical protein [Komagataeibacter sp. FNDCR1]